MKKYICLILALFMIVGIFSACGKGNTAKVPIPSDVNEDGMFVYSITRSASASTQLESSVKNMRSTLKKGLDCNIVMLKDSIADYDGNYEILVGQTNRQESIDATQKLKDNRPNNNMDFIVKVTGEKIVVTATTDSMIDVACRWFAENFNSIEKWNMLYDGYEFMYTPENDAIVNTVSGTNMGFFTVVVPAKWPYLCGREADKFVSEMFDLGYTVATNLDTADAVTNEIIFGDTSREESKSVKVDGDNYIIKVEGTKLIIKGGSDLATYQAIADFNEMLDNAVKDNKPLELADGTVINGKYSADKKGTYTLNFDDSFNSPTVNYKIWSNYGDRSNESSGSASCLGGTNYYANIYNKEYIYAKDGAMLLHSRKISDVDFRSAEVSTCYSMAYRYGFWEVNAKFPKQPGTVAIWTNCAYISTIKAAIGDLDREAFTEIDLVENFGSDLTFASNVHRWANGMTASGDSSSLMHTSWDGDQRFNSNENNRKYKWLDEENRLSDDFHIYSYYSDNECIEFAFDGHVYCKYDFKEADNSVSFHCMQNFLIMDCSMGGSSYGTKWKEGMPEDVHSEIDYCRVYQTDSVNSLMRYGYGYQSDKNNYPSSPVLTYVYPETHRTY